MDFDGFVVVDVDCDGPRDMFICFAFTVKAGLCPWWLLISEEIAFEDELDQVWRL